MANNRFSEVAELINDAPLSDSGWNTALNAIGEYVGRKRVCVGNQLLPTGIPTIFSSSSIRGAVREVQKDFNEAGKNGAHNILLSKAMGGRLISCRDIFLNDQREISSERALWMQKIGFDNDVITVFNYNKNKKMSIFALFRDFDCPYMNKEEILRANEFIPYIRRSFLMTDLLIEEKEKNRIFASVFDSLSFAVLIVDADRKVFHLNDCAQRLINEQAGIALVHGKLEFADRRAAQWLAQEVALTISGRVSRDAGSTFEIAQPPLKFLEIAVCSSSRGSDVPSSHAIVTILDPSLRMQIAIDRLSRVHGLSPMQTRIAAMILDGRENSSIAIELNISVNTLKTHIRRLYAKLGCENRTDFHRTLNSMPG